MEVFIIEDNFIIYYINYIYKLYVYIIYYINIIEDLYFMSVSIQAQVVCKSYIGEFKLYIHHY